MNTAIVYGIGKLQWQYVSVFDQRTYQKGIISAYLIVSFTYILWPEYGLKKGRNMLPLKDTNIIHYFCGPGGINPLFYRIS